MSHGMIFSAVYHEAITCYWEIRNMTEIWTELPEYLPFIEHKSIINQGISILRLYFLCIKHINLLLVYTSWQSIESTSDCLMAVLVNPYNNKIRTTLKAWSDYSKAFYL